MNSSAFSCGDSATSAQLVGGGSFWLSQPTYSPPPPPWPWPPVPPLPPQLSLFPDTWRSLNTARPQTVDAPTGVSNEKYMVLPLMPELWSAVIHGCDGTFAEVTVALYRGS